jgi:hypothetical protein
LAEQQLGVADYGSGLGRRRNREGACGDTKRRAGCKVNGRTRSARGSAMEAGNRAHQKDLVGGAGAVAGSGAGRWRRRSAGRPSLVRRGRERSRGSVWTARHGAPAMRACGSCGRRVCDETFCLSQLRREAIGLFLTLEALFFSVTNTIRYFLN